MTPCAHPGCTRLIHGRHYCSGHYQRMRKGRDMDAPFPKRAPRLPRKGFCRISGCGRPVGQNGLCLTHYKRRRTQPGNWSGPVEPHGILHPLGNLYLPVEHHHVAREEARVRGVSISHVLREAVAEWVERRLEEERQRSLWRKGGAA